MNTYDKNRSSFAVYLITILTLIISVISNAFFLYKKWDEDGLYKISTFMVIGISLLYILLLDVNIISANSIHIILSCISSVLYIVVTLSILMNKLNQYQNVINNIALVIEGLVLFALLIINYLGKMNTGKFGFVLAVMCVLVFVILHVIMILKIDELQIRNIFIGTGVIFLVFFASVYDLFDHDGVLLWVFLVVGITLSSMIYDIWNLCSDDNIKVEQLILNFLKIDVIILIFLMYVSIVLNGSNSLMLQIAIIIIRILHEMFKHESQENKEVLHANPYNVKKFTDEERAKLDNETKNKYNMSKY